LVAITAQQILDETGWAAGDIGSKTIIEHLIDRAINYINGETGLSISNMTGVAESKTVTVTAAQAPVIKAWVELLCRAYINKGPSASLSAMSVTEVVSDPHYKIMVKMANQGVNRLRGRTFERT